MTTRRNNINHNNNQFGRSNGNASDRGKSNFRSCCQQASIRVEADLTYIKVQLIYYTQRLPGFRIPDYDRASGHSCRDFFPVRTECRPEGRTAVTREIQEIFTGGRIPYAYAMTCRRHPAAVWAINAVLAAVGLSKKGQDDFSGRDIPDSWRGIGSDGKNSFSIRTELGSKTGSKSK